MRHTTRFAFTLWCCVLLASAACPAAEDNLAIRLVKTEDGNSIEIHGFGSDVSQRISAESTDSVSLPAHVYVLENGRPLSTEVAGSWASIGSTVRFLPKYPLRPGTMYQIEFDLAGWADYPDATPRWTGNILVTAEPHEPAYVTEVYPSREVLPENLLKFYIHFSAPMSQGEAYKRIQLRHATGQIVPFPFLEIGEELWNPSGTRLTLLFDPGRIKRGLRPREEVGAALQEGHSYQLVVDSEWKDATGQPLRAEYRKRFKVVKADSSQPKVDDWKLELPAVGTVQPLTVTFPKPLDHALLERLIDIVDNQGRPVTGLQRILDRETRWQFTPASEWAASDYEMVIDKTLEDTAGNSLGRPFEVDAFHVEDHRRAHGTVRVPFRPD